VESFSRQQPDGGTCKPSSLATLHCWYSSISRYGEPKKAYTLVPQGSPRVVLFRCGQLKLPSKNDDFQVSVKNINFGMVKGNLDAWLLVRQSVVSQFYVRIDFSEKEFI
jgi:hypothetical protein